MDEDRDGWQRRPTKQDAEREYTIIRTPARGMLYLTIISGDMVGRVTHFDNSCRRTVPCVGEGCDNCGRGIRKEWHGYLACWHEERMRKVILEVTAGPGRFIGEVYDRMRSLRGVQICLGRKDGRVNGEVWIKRHADVVPDAKLPTASDLRPILLRMWQVTKLVETVPVKIRKPRLAATGTEGPQTGDPTSEID